MTDWEAGIRKELYGVAQSRLALVFPQAHPKYSSKDSGEINRVNVC